MAKYGPDPGGAGKQQPKKKGGTSPFGGGGPPPVAPSGGKAKSERAQFLAYVGAHPSLKNYAGAIWNAAAEFGGITALQIAAVILAESSGNPTAGDPGAAYGLGQIKDNVASPANAQGVPFFRPNHNISLQDKQNPAFVARYIAWRIGGYMAQNGVGLDDAWRQGYGGDQPGNFISRNLPKGYVGIGPSTVVSTANRSGNTTAVEQGAKDPWVVAKTTKEVGPDGKITTKLLSLKKVFSAVSPKGVVMFDGLPMRLSDWDHLARQLQPYFVSYTGGRPDANTLYQYISKGWSTYSLTVALAKNKNFTKSPIWKQNAPAYQDAAKSLLPNGATAPKSLITSAIVNSWSTGTFQAVLRKAPGYVQSNEFESNVAALQNVHQSIMGVPDEQAATGIKQAALAGWDANQYANYLRAQPQYQQSPEYQTKTLQFLTQLGLITGQNPVAYKGTSPLPNKNINLEGALANDPRVKGKDALTNPEDTVVTYGK